MSWRARRLSCDRSSLLASAPRSASPSNCSSSQVIVVVGPPHEPTAAHLAAVSNVEVAQLTPRDLSRPGWYLRIGHPSEQRAVIGGRVVPSPEIQAVVM